MTLDAKGKTPDSLKRDIQKDPILMENFSCYSTFLNCKVLTAYDGEKIKKGLRVLEKTTEESPDAYRKKFVRIGSIFEVTNGGVLKVQWDSSSESKDFVRQEKGQYNLLLFDNAQIEVKHTLVHCRGCGQYPLRGIRWECDGCFDYDLCTKCYMHDQHLSSGHVFKRIQSENAKGILMNRRNSGYNFSIEIDGDARVVKRKSKEDDEEHKGTVNRNIHTPSEAYISDIIVQRNTRDFGSCIGRDRQSYVEHYVEHYVEQLPQLSCDQISIGLRVAQNDKGNCSVGSVVNIKEIPEIEGKVESKPVLPVGVTRKSKHIKEYDVQWDNGNYQNYNSKDDSIKKWDDGPGTVIELRDKKLEVFRSDAKVKWNDSELSHPIGRDGICELKLVDNGRGKQYYHEHLPFVSSDTIFIGLRVVKNQPKNVKKNDDVGHNFVGSVVYKKRKYTDIFDKYWTQRKSRSYREMRANEENRKTIEKVGVRWDNGYYESWDFTENLLRIWDNGPLVLLFQKKSPRYLVYDIEQYMRI